MIIHISPGLNFALTVLSGLCWTLVYLLIVYRSVKDKTYGMPFWALAFNICWEFIFSVVFAADADSTQLVVNRVWLGFDVFILVTYFLYGRKEWPVNVPRIFFFPYSVIVLVTSYLFVYLVTVKFGDHTGMYIAFIQNLMMSWLFIAMLNRRNSLAGQSFAIAVLKMIGTLTPTIQYSGKSPLVMFLGIGCFVADCIYIAMVAGFHSPKRRAL